MKNYIIICTSACNNHYTDHFALSAVIFSPLQVTYINEVT